MASLLGLRWDFPVAGGLEWSVPGARIERGCIFAWVCVSAGCPAVSWAYCEYGGCGGMCMEVSPWRYYGGTCVGVSSWRNMQRVVSMEECV